jgi:hypothetical protein
MTGDFAAEQLFYRFFDVMDLDQRIGLLSALLTLDKSSIVNAINSLKLYIDGILESSEVAGSPYESYVTFVAGAGASITPSKYAYVTFIDTDTWPSGGKWDQIVAGETWRLDCSDTQWLPTSNMTAATTATLIDGTATDALKQPGNDNVTEWLQNFRNVLKGLLLKFVNGVSKDNLAEGVQKSLDKADLVVVGSPTATNNVVIHVDSVGGDDSKDGFSEPNRVQTLTRVFQILASLKTSAEVIIQCYDDSNFTVPAGTDVRTSLTVILNGVKSDTTKPATFHVSSTSVGTYMLRLMGNWTINNVNFKATFNNNNVPILECARGIYKLASLYFDTEDETTPTYTAPTAITLTNAVIDIRGLTAKHLYRCLYLSRCIGNIGSPQAGTSVTQMYMMDRCTLFADTIADGVTYSGNPAIYTGGASTFNYGHKQYTTSEQFTGKMWIDGKPIYRRVFTGNIVAVANSVNAVIAYTSGISKLISISGWWQIGGTIASKFNVGSLNNNTIENKAAYMIGYVNSNSGLGLESVSPLARTGTTNNAFEVCVEYTRV